MKLKRSVVLLIALFLVTNVLGLLAAQNMQQFESIQETKEQHQDAASGVYFFVLIGISTALMLLLYHFDVQFLVQGWFTLALFMTMLLFFDAFLPGLYAIGLSIILLIARLRTDNITLKNALTIFSFAGAGAFFGSIIGLQAAIALYVVLSVYDYFSVNISEHMVALAKSGMKTNTFMGFTYPKEEGGIDPDQIDMEDMDTAPDSKNVPDDAQAGGVGILGGGDIVMPLMFAATLLPDYGMRIALVSVAGAAVGLAFLLSKAQEGKFYPAIPPVAIGSIVGFGIGYAVLVALL